ncbi:MAG: thiamine pyrophosphate-dependent enzyme [Nocardioidaceae bacterium]
MDFVKFAEACGAFGVRAEKRGECGDALKQAMEYDGPAIVEMVIDPHEPPMPAKVKKDQVTKMFEALKAGTPNRNTIAAQMVKDVLDESSFEASPGGVIPEPVAKMARSIADKAARRTRED